MGLQSVAFMHSQDSFGTMFLKHCSCESLWTSSCITTMVGVSKDMPSVKYFCSNKAFLCLLHFL